MKFNLWEGYKPLFDYTLKIPEEHKLKIGLFKNEKKFVLNKDGSVSYIHESEVGE